MAIFILPISYTDKYNVTFISLNCFKVFNKEMFVYITAEIFFKFWLFPEVEFNFFKNCLLLLNIERSYTQTLSFSVSFIVLTSSFNNTPCFHPIGSTSATIIHCIFHILKL